MAARLAADLCSPADIADGRKLVAEGGRAVQSGRMEDLIGADMQFHMWIYRGAGNPLLAETMGLYWNHLRRVMSATLRRPARRQEIRDGHEALLKATIGPAAKRPAKRPLRPLAHARLRTVAAV